MQSNQSTFIKELGYLVDEFDELQDLRWSDLEYLAEYRELKMKKNDGLSVDQNRLEELESRFKNKIITSARWNKFQNALLGMQTFIKEEVENFVLNKQKEMNDYVDIKKIQLDTEINKFQYRGTYSPDIQYFQRNMVDFNDGSGVQTYICIKDSLGNEPTDINYFKKLTIKGARGEKGKDGVGLKFKGEYKNTTTYAKDDGVQYGGILFASLVDGNIDNEPNLTQDTPYWARALDVTVTTRPLIGVRNIVTPTDTVNFMTGEITSYNRNIDGLSVYKNTVRLTKDKDYIINPDNQSITKIDGIWEASPDAPVFFEFEVMKNILNNLVFSDGSAIEDGTVSKSKLTEDVQGDLNKIQQIDNKIDILSGVSGTNEKANKTEFDELKLDVLSLKNDVSNLQIGINGSKSSLVNSINAILEM